MSKRCPTTVKQVDKTSSRFGFMVQTEKEMNRRQPRKQSELHTGGGGKRRRSVSIGSARSCSTHLPESCLWLFAYRFLLRLGRVDFRPRRRAPQFEDATGHRPNHVAVGGKLC